MKLVHLPTTTVPGFVGFTVTVVASVLVWRFAMRMIPLPPTVKSAVSI